MGRAIGWNASIRSLTLGALPIKCGHARPGFPTVVWTVQVVGERSPEADGNSTFGGGSGVSTEPDELGGDGAARRTQMAVDFLTELESCVPALRRYARSLLRDRDAADDLVQDCLERALGRRRQWRGGASLRPWLFRIMHNMWANEVRRRATRPAHEPIDRAYDLPSAGDVQTARLAVRDMERALDLLPEEQRAIVLMVAVSGMSYQECAEALKVPLGTVMSRLWRGRERLRALMQGQSVPLLRRVK
jgi:RNA polymerase sigma-70 factor (ECF subfamily)